MPHKLNLDDFIGKVPNFPKPGVLFYDINKLIMDPIAYAEVINRMSTLYSQMNFDAIAGIEARGFLFGSTFAYQQRLPFIAVRKPGKLPGKVHSVSYSLEYGQDSVEIQENPWLEGKRILLVDDLIATGGTLTASYELFKQAGAHVAYVFGVIGLPFLNYEEKLSPAMVTTLINYDENNNVIS